MTHRSRNCKVVVLLLSLVLLLSSASLADVRLPHIIGSNMVLQRDMPLPVWGWADPGEAVTVKIGPNTVKTTADAKGAWKLTLPAMKAGGPYQMAVSGANNILLTDILIGEVWICSGQSNMEWGIGMVDNFEQEISAANYPNIRLFQVSWKTSGQPLPDVDAAWRVCSPETIQENGRSGFSGVAYFFGRELHSKLNVPIGLVNTTWGGTRIEPWTPVEGFERVPELSDILKTIAPADSAYRAQLAVSLRPIEIWIPKARKALETGGEIPAPPEWPMHPLNSNSQPTSLYNAMVHPLVPFAIRGAIWYQGESNCGEGMMYYQKMKALIGGWRAVWNQGDFPFYYVQLAPFQYAGGDKPLLLPEIWEAQTASLSIPNTGMAVTVDVGNIKDVHPRNKQDVGKRLSLWALAKTYDFTDIVYSGPLYKSMSIEVNKVRIHFDHAENGLATRDGNELTWFEIAGEDKKFVKAQAEIDSATVLVWSRDVPKPAAVRFAWSEVAEPNLMNKDKLPASPFRTDRW